MKNIDNKKLNYILYRLYWNDVPIGFEYWSGDSKELSYTHGIPEKKDGYLGWGWDNKMINHNRKEIIDFTEAEWELDPFMVIKPKESKEPMIVGKTYKILGVKDNLHPELQPEETICDCVEIDYMGYDGFAILMLMDKCDKDIEIGIGGWLVNTTNIFYEEVK